MVPFPTPLGPQITIGRGRSVFSLLLLLSTDEDDVWRCSLLEEADADRSRVAALSARILRLLCPKLCDPSKATA